MDGRRTYQYFASTPVASLIWEVMHTYQVEYAAHYGPLATTIGHQPSKPVVDGLNRALFQLVLESHEAIPMAMATAMGTAIPTVTVTAMATGMKTGMATAIPMGSVMANGNGHGLSRQELRALLRADVVERALHLRRLGVPALPLSIPWVMDGTGINNVSSATSLVALEALAGQRAIRPGTVHLVVGLGIGASYQAHVIRFR